MFSEGCPCLHHKDAQSHLLVREQSVRVAHVTGRPTKDEVELGPVFSSRPGRPEIVRITAGKGIPSNSENLDQIGDT